MNAREEEYLDIRVRRALLADTPYSYLERSSIQLLAYSPARSFPSTSSTDAGLSRVLPVEPSWALYLHIGTVSRSGEPRKRAALSGRPRREEARAIRERERETGSGRRASRLRG